MTEAVPTSLKALMAAANAAVPRVTPAEARAMAAAGALLVDVRDANEVAAAGGIEGAINISRGMLEFRADPDSPVFDARFDRAKPVVLLCASGGRAALGGEGVARSGLWGGVQCRGGEGLVGGALVPFFPSSRT